MPAAAHPEHEQDRLAALRSLRVLDTPPEPGFDALTDLAREAFGTPIALVSLVDEHRQWFKSAAGLDACETPRSQSVCAYVVLESEPLVIEDLAADERTSDNPLVTGEPGLRFYAGAPIVLPSGEAVGSFCVLDTEPRSVTPAQVGTLERLASACAALLEARMSACKLNDADRRMQAIQDAAPVAILQLEPVRDSRTRIVDFTITDANVMADRMFGSRGFKLQGLSLFERLPTIATCADGAVKRALLHTATSGDPTKAECGGASQDTRISTRWSVARHDGALVVSVEDITDRVSREFELERSRDLLEQTQALSGVGGWAVDLVTMQPHWTEQTFAIHGVPSEQGEPDLERAIEFYAPEHRELVRVAVETAIANAEPFDFEADIIRTDGVRVPVRSVGHPVVQSGRVVRLVGAFQDLTQIRAEQDQLDRNLAMLRAMSEGTSDLIFVKDLEGRFLFVNPAMAAFCGLPLNELLGKIDSDVMPPDVARICREGDLEAVRNNAPTTINEQILTPTGTRHFKTLKQPYALSDGTLVGVIALCHDVTEIREQQDERHRLTETIKAITDASSDVIFVKDREGKLIFCNPAFAKAVGQPIDELIGTTDYKHLDEDASRRLRQTDELVLRTNAPVRTEERVTLPGLEGERILESEKHPYRLPDGSIGGVIGVARDMTAIRNALEEVRTSEQRLSFALSAASVGFWDHDMITDSVYYADTWFTMLGYEPGELPMTVECFWDRLLHPDDLDMMRAAHKSYMEGQADTYDVQCRLRHKSGSWHWVRDIGSIIERDAEGQPSRVVGVHVDIDERKREQDLLETALVAANEGLWEWSIPDNLCYFDDMWYKLLGYEPGELPMEFETWESLCHPDDLESVQLALGRYIRGEAEGYSFEHRLWTKQCTWKWVLGTGKITERDEQGRPVRVVGVTMDIDDRMYAAETLEHALDAAEAANLAKSQFLANMSHEIRTPMTAIVGYAELMATDADVMGDHKLMRETAAIVQRNGEHLLALINDILDLSKIDAGKMTTESVRTNLLELISDVYELHRGRAMHKGIRLEIQQRDALPDAVLADPVRIRQILMNLVNNAIKFTESGSVTIRVEALSGESGREETTAHQTPPRLRLSVTDTGIGMSEEHVTKLFSAFEQADDSMVRRFGGTGLGLAISERLAELMDGGVTVRSRLGSGSTFTLDLPLHVAEHATWIEPGSVNGHTEPGSEPVDARGEKPLAGVRVLLVEDGLDNQRLISHHLKKAGAEVSIANNGNEGVDLVEAGVRNAEPFGVVLMDMQMPVMDGYTAARTIRDRGCRVPIVAITAHAMTGDRDRCLAAGCDEYETKPIARARLIELCTKLIRQRRRAA